VSRIVKPREVRRDEILATAQRLFYSLGYERTTINAMIKELDIAKGTFYHYFQSKGDLLDALVDRLTEQIVAALQPVLEGHGSAVEKLREVYRVSSSIKTSDWDFLIQITKALYSDENIVVRHKMNQRNMELVAPIFTKVFGQGASEGVFDLDDPQETARAVLALWTHMGETTAHLLLGLVEEPDTLEVLERKLRMFETLMERMVGARKGSLGIIDAAGILPALRLMIDERTSKTRDKAREVHSDQSR
jgi:AcrR family transcriptional regulator